MFSIYITDPQTDMLLGFMTQLVGLKDKETEEEKEGTMFSIGLFFIRVDYIFNITLVENEEE